MQADIEKIERNTHLLDWLNDGWTHCQHGTRGWCESYLHNARDVIKAQDDELSRLGKVERRAKEVIREQAEELLWSAYAYGIEANGRWWDGGLSDAEWLTRELELPSGWNDTSIVRQMISGAADRIAARALATQVEERE